jgi:hypothetical protein
MPAKAFTRQGLTLQLSSPHETDLQWLADFLEPGFRLETDTAPDWEIRVQESAEHYEALMKQGADEEGKTIPCFSFDDHIANYRLWRESLLTIYDDELDLFYSIDTRKRVVEVLTGRRLLSIRVALLRLVREFASHHLALNGDVTFHAAAISYEGNGILICGPKKAGKTSFIIHALQYPKTKLISNDRSILSNDTSHGLTLSGMPTVITIRQGTMALFSRPPFNDRRHWRARMSLDEALELPASSEADDVPEKLDLNPSQFCHLLECGMSEAAPLKAVIFPMVNEEQSGTKLIRLTEREVAERLEQNQFPLAPSPFSTTTEQPPIADAAKQIIDKLSSGSPGFQCILGQGAFQGPSLCEQVLKLL